MDPEILLNAAMTALRQRPPPGLELGDVEAFFGRHRAALLEIVRKALPTARLEPAFTRLREEHRLARRVLDAARLHQAQGGPAAVGRALAELVEALDDHVAYEDGTLFPSLRAQVPALALALEHAREEHAAIGAQLAALAADLRAGRRYAGPALEATLHHFAEEEAQIVGPALAAGLARTPAGGPSRLLARAADIEALAAPLAAPAASTPPYAPELDRALSRLAAALRLPWLHVEQVLLQGFRFAREGKSEAARAALTAAGLEPHDLGWARQGDVTGLGARLRDSLALSLALDSAPGEQEARAEVLARQVLPPLVALEQAAGVPPAPSPKLEVAFRVAQGLERPERVVQAESAFETDPPDPAPAPGEPTRWGGRRGAELPPAEIAQGMRVVTQEGEHGVVTEVSRIVFTSLVGSRRTDDDVHHSFTLRLDSGRALLARGALYAELAGPLDVVPDIPLGHQWLGPAEVWSRAYDRYRDISTYADKAEAARKPEMKAHWKRHSAAARREFHELYQALAAWRAEHPHEPVPGLREHLWRRVTLEANEARTEDESWELAWLKRVPADWETRFHVGDRVLVHVLGPYGRQPDGGWTVSVIAGQRATLTRGDERREEPLWMLKADDTAPFVETFAEPRYLRELAQEMLVKTGETAPYPSRGAVARAVKTFLSEHGIAVSTHVRQGSMVTGIDFSPPSGRWSPDEMARMRALLPGLKVWNETLAQAEPWQTVGESYDPYGDYHGKSAGLLLPVEHLPRFAAILATAMKAEGQALNALGERRLAAASPPRTAAIFPTGPRSSATAEQRASAAEGCRELDFELPGYGRVRVVCGAQGRRDVWSNIYLQQERYGFNGGRWARGLRPPEPVLAAIRERGVTIFGG